MEGAENQAPNVGQAQAQPDREVRIRHGRSGGFSAHHPMCDVVCVQKVRWDKEDVVSMAKAMQRLKEKPPKSGDKRKRTCADDAEKAIKARLAGLFREVPLPHGDKENDIDQADEEIVDLKAFQMNMILKKLKVVRCLARLCGSLSRQQLTCRVRPWSWRWVSRSARRTGAS
jgi:hypothetical protein